MKILVISPHGDDEILGLGGLLRRWSGKHEIKVVTVCSDGKRDSEIRKCHRMMDLESEILGYPDGKLDTIQEALLVGEIDQQIEQSQCEMLFIPYRSPHVGHKAVYDACLASLRLKNGQPQVTEVYYYEYPFINTYDQVNGGATYHTMTKEELEQKVIDFEVYYESQNKVIPSPLNRRGIETLASMRGMECGVEYAEKFYLHHKIVRNGEKE